MENTNDRITKTMTKRQSLEATFAGLPVDRPAVALWRHWPVDDHSGEDLARATIDFQRTNDFDFIKITLNSDYCLSGYGAVSRWEGNPEGSYGLGRLVIDLPEDIQVEARAAFEATDGRRFILGTGCVPRSQRQHPIF